MPITQLNHAVLYVRDARRHQVFYADVLGFQTVTDHPDGRYAFMRAPGSDNHHDIAFFSVGESAGASEAGRRTVGMYHLAWEISTLGELRAIHDVLRDAGALVGSSDHGVSKSLYARDPDGLEFEVMWRVPEEHWGAAATDAVIAPLDLAAEIRRFAELA